jgi:hypothetical protein
MFGKRLTIAEKTVKIAIGVGKLAATGGLSLDTAKTVIDMLKDGQSLYGKLTREQKLAQSPMSSGPWRQRLAEAEASPEAVSGAAPVTTCAPGFEQALDHCIPAPEALQATRPWTLRSTARPHRMAGHRADAQTAACRPPRKTGHLLHRPRKR